MNASSDRSRTRPSGASGTNETIARRERSANGRMVAALESETQSTAGWYDADAISYHGAYHEPTERPQAIGEHARINEHDGID